MERSLFSFLCVVAFVASTLLSCEDSKPPTGVNEDITGEIYGDTTWVRAIEHVTGSLHARAMVADHDDGFIIVGLGGSAGDTTNGFFLKVEADGHPFWYRDVSFGVRDVALHPNGGYVIVGNSDSMEVKLYLISRNGDVFWGHSIPGKIGNGVDVAGNGEVLFTGTSTDGRLLQGSFNSDGSENWVRTYNTSSNADHGFDVAVHGTGSLITGEIRSQEFGQREIVLLETDDGGNELQRATYGDFLGDTGFRVHALDDRSALIAGSMYTFGSGNRDATLIYVDQSMIELFTITIAGDDSDDNALDVLMRDKTAVVAGNLGPELLLACINIEEGYVEWKRTYPGGGDGRAIVRHPHGGLVVAGRCDSDEDLQSEIYLFRCFSDGKLEYSSQVVDFSPVQ